MLYTDYGTYQFIPANPATIEDRTALLVPIAYTLVSNHASDLRYLPTLYLPSRVYGTTSPTRPSSVPASFPWASVTSVSTTTVLPFLPEVTEMFLIKSVLPSRVSSPTASSSNGASGAAACGFRRTGCARRSSAGRPWSLSPLSCAG